MRDDAPEVFRFYVMEAEHIVQVETFECAYAELDEKCRAVLDMHPRADKIEVWDGPNRLHSCRRQAHAI